MNHVVETEHRSYPNPIKPMVVCDQKQTAAALDFAELIHALAVAAKEVAAGLLLSPERLVVPVGEGGVLLSMPATAPDIAIHKLVNVHPGNAKRGLATLHGAVTVCDAATGRLLCLLDGPEVTGRRTAAVSMLAIKTLLPAPPTRIMLIGTGAQAAYHLEAIAAIYPMCEVQICGRSLAAAEAFCVAHQKLSVLTRACDLASVPASLDVVITLTTAKSPVYNEPPCAGRLVIGVGAFKPDMAELGTVTLEGSDLYADDPAGARHEAGDLLRAGIDWARVGSLADMLVSQPDLRRPLVFKSVGTAAWDLAAARVALKSLGL
jgi:1-piperideine-2-carboxylate/1-pyrroline-2-carboxylate reductase [NAD(P)H]